MKTSSLFKVLPVFLIGPGLAVFYQWWGGRNEPVPERGSEHGAAEQAMAAFAPGKPEDRWSKGGTDLNAAGPLEVTASWESFGDRTESKANLAVEGGPSSQTESVAADLSRTQKQFEPGRWSQAGRARTAANAGRPYEVPRGLAGRPLPVFIRWSAGQLDGGATASGNLLPPPSGVKSLPEVSEERVLAEAERIFSAAMTVAPTQDASAPEYEDWWRAAQERSENYLRLALGWDRFNTLTRAQMESEWEQTQAEDLSGSAGDAARLGTDE